MDIINNMGKMLEKALHNALIHLPSSPFSAYINNFNDMPYLGYINYFLPISEIIAITETWVVAVGTYYLISVVLRWIKAIE